MDGTKLEGKLCAKYNILSDTPEELMTELQRQHPRPFVYGRGKRKSELQRDIEQLTQLVCRKDKYAGYQATFMHMKDGHMRNAQLKPGYNIQLGVEDEYINQSFRCCR